MTTPLEGELRDGFKFRSGHVALDLTTTLSGRLWEQTKELLAGPEDLGRWLVAAGLARRRPRVSPVELQQGRALREVLYRLALARASGRRLPSVDRNALNRFAAAAVPPPRLESDGSVVVEGATSELLALLARDGVGLLGGQVARRIRKCASGQCAILFVDASRKGDRRWCSMAACGNRAKAAEFRRRSW